MDKNEWRTPREFFESYNKLYGFTWDLAASDKNHLCKKYYTKEQDALQQTWGVDCNMWLNPPYSGRGLLDAWVIKALDECVGVKQGRYSEHWKRIVMLLPVRTDTKWFSILWGIFMNHIRYEPDRDFTRISQWTKVSVDLDFLRKRISFLDDTGKEVGKPREPNLVVTLFAGSWNNE